MSEGFACQGALWRLRVPPSCAGTHPFLSPNPFFLDRSSENPLLASTHRSAGRPTTPLALTFRRIRHEPPRYIPSSSDLTLDQLPPLLPRSALLIQLLCWRGWPSKNAEMLFDISASPKRNAMTGWATGEIPTGGSNLRPRDRRLWQTREREREAARE